MRRTLPLLLLTLASAAAFAAGPPTEPVLTINARMHTSAIRRIDADAAGRLLLTGSLDKTARLWDAATGDLLRVLRPPLDSGNDGKIYAAALSPDGKTAVVSGWTGYDWDGKISLYLFDAGTGELVRKVPGLPNVPYDLRFSPDGRRLAASLGAGAGVFVFDAADWSVAARLEGYGDNVQAASFDGKGRLVTCCWDGRVRLYGADLRLLREAALTGGTRPLSAEFSPDGARIAVGFQDAAEVQILDPDTLAVDRRLAFEKNYESDYLGVVRWARDGKSLWCAGARWTRDGESWRTAVRHWDLADLRFTEYPVARNSIQDLRVLPDGGVAWCGYQPDMGRLDGSGRSLFTWRGESMAFTTGRTDMFRLAPDGLSLGFQPQDSDPFSFYVGNRQLARAQSSLPAAAASAGGTTVSDWAGTAPRINGKAVSFLSRNETCRSAAVAASGKTVVWGTDWYLTCTDASGKVLWKTYSPGSTWAVQTAEAAGLAAAAFADGTIRWFRLRDGAELLALFAHPDGTRWVLWTPSGHFDCSPGGQDLIGWSVNPAGGGAAADFFPAGSFSARFYRPDVTQAVLKTLDGKAALETADRRKAVQAERTDLLASLPPVVLIREPEDDASVPTEKVRVAADVRSPSGDPVREVRALVDGRPSGAALSGLSISSRTGERVSLDVPLQPGEHQVHLIARGSSGWSLPAGVAVTRGTAEQGPAAAPPVLHALLAGAPGDLVSSAARSGGTPAGAEDLSKALRSSGVPYKDVRIETLWGDAMETLAARVHALAEASRTGDTVLLVLRGYGFVGTDGEPVLAADAGDEAALKDRGVSLYGIAEGLSALPARVALFLEIRPMDDAFDLTGLVNRLASPETGVAVVARRAAAGTPGFLALLAEGASGGADVTGDGVVSVNEMVLFLNDALEKSGGILSAKPETVRDFPL